MLIATLVKWKYENIIGRGNGIKNVAFEYERFIRKLDVYIYKQIVRCVVINSPVCSDLNKLNQLNIV